jgi:hypothetical protein
MMAEDIMGNGNGSLRASARSCPRITRCIDGTQRGGNVAPFSYKPARVSIPAYPPAEPPTEAPTNIPEIIPGAAA